MLPRNFTKAGQVEAILNLMKKKFIAWVTIVQQLHMPMVLNLNPGRRSGEYEYIRPSYDLIKYKLLAFSLNPRMSFEGFLHSLTVQELGTVRQAVEQAAEVPRHLKFGAAMEFAQIN